MSRLQGTEAGSQSVQCDPMRQALQELVNVAVDIVACYADVIGTDSEPGWIEDLRLALKPARAALAEPSTLEARPAKPACDQCGLTQTDIAIARTQMEYADLPDGETPICCEIADDAEVSNG